MLLLRAMELMLVELLDPVGSDALRKTIQKLGVRHPGEVYGFLAGVYKVGVDAQ
jgi:hypothetical protein